MIADPIVLILREAAARGRQLRLARDRAAQDETRPDSGIAEVRLPGAAISMFVTPQLGDSGVNKENST